VVTNFRYGWFCELQKIVLTELPQGISQKLIKKVPNASYNSKFPSFWKASHMGKTILLDL